MQGEGLKARCAAWMEVCDCVDAALTRARQARLPSPWTGRGTLAEPKAERAKESATCAQRTE
jgi:hypothetical protein